MMNRQKQEIFKHLILGFLFFSVSSIASANKPFVMVEKTLLKAENGFLVSQSCYLQRNLPEHLDLMKLGWLRELKSLLIDPVYRDWVLKHIQKSTEVSSDAYASGGRYMGSQEPEKIRILEYDDLLKIATQWHKRLGKGSQGVDRLMLRLLMINDIVKNGAAIRELMAFRSIASSDETYKVISLGLNLDDHWQPLDIFFETSKANPQIASEIRAFRHRTGLNWVGSKHGKCF